MMKLVILAGGKGTRLGLKDIPKPMVQLMGKPLLEYQILLARKYGLKDIYILSGHLSNVIVDYFQDGSKWGVNIKHITEDKPLGTAGALKQLETILKEKFIVFYGDTVMDINLKKLIEFDKKKSDSSGTLIVHPNDHPYDSDLVEIDENNRIIAFHSKPHTEDMYYANLVNAALYLLSPEIFKYIDDSSASDFGKDIFPQVIKNESLYAYKTSEYIKDMGTPERLKAVENDIESGKVAKRNKTFNQRAIFLDRDGVINKEVGNLRSINEFELIEGISESIKKINKSEYISIVITNQPGVAKGFISIAELNKIHKKMDMMLGHKKAYVDDLYYCPHHPEKGFAGEVEQLKTDCDCRKPKIGLLAKAADDYHIDLNKSWMIGDRYADICAGHTAGCKTILVLTGHAGNDKKKYMDVEADFKFETLNDAINFILHKDISI